MVKNSYKKTVKPMRNKKTIHRNPKCLPPTLSIPGTKYIGVYQFDIGNEVPIYETESVHGFTQLIGHAKFNNKHYGNVYYRGECKLHSTLKPSLFRTCTKTEKVTEKLTTLIKKISSDEHMENTIKIATYHDKVKQHIIEGVLQHYGVPTRFIDVVDNHWVALWMGNNKSERIKKVNEYYHYTQRTIPYVELLNGDSFDDEELFQYVLLLAIPFPDEKKHSGIQSSYNFVEVDLRQALPSVFLRPHVQHGLVVRKKTHDSSYANDYDMASTVIGIVRIRVDNVQKWIGDGALLSQNTLFPPPAYDYGYDLLLARSDLFEDTDFSIARYI